MIAVVMIRKEMAMDYLKLLFWDSPKKLRRTAKKKKIQSGQRQPAQVRSISRIKAYCYRYTNLLYCDDYDLVSNVKIRQQISLMCHF